MSVYYIGGSPCSGKSTVAETLARRYGLEYFKVDDHLDRYIRTAAEHGNPVCAKVIEMSPEETWMRPPTLQCVEELAIYSAIFEFVCADIDLLGGNVITEGAAFLPRMMHTTGVDFNRYLCITPTEEFQISRYSQREWVKFVLEGCSDKQQAFANWMRRDVLFARDIEAQCASIGYTCLLQDGTILPEDMANTVAEYFGL